MHRSRPCNASYEKRFPIHTFAAEAQTSPVIQFGFGPIIHFIPKANAPSKGRSGDKQRLFTADHNASSMGNLNVGVSSPHDTIFHVLTLIPLQ